MAAAALPKHSAAGTLQNPPYAQQYTLAHTLHESLGISKLVKRRNNPPKVCRAQKMHARLAHPEAGDRACGPWWVRRRRRGRQPPGGGAWPADPKPVAAPGQRRAQGPRLWAHAGAMRAPCMRPRPGASDAACARAAQTPPAGAARRWNAQRRLRGRQRHGLRLAALAAAGVRCCGRAAVRLWVRVHLWELWQVWVGLQRAEGRVVVRQRVLRGGWVGGCGEVVAGWGEEWRGGGSGEVVVGGACGRGAHGAQARVTGLRCAAVRAGWRAVAAAAGGRAASSAGRRACTPRPTPHSRAP
jgi:hypothetical protein